MNKPDRDRALAKSSVIVKDPAVTADIGESLCVYGFRNNFFHGDKWAYELREHNQKFANANVILARSIELNRRL